MGIKKILYLLIVLSFLLIGASSCFTPQQSLQPGRCVTNTDCPQKTKCTNTYCEDIYFPRKYIKNY